ncbi:MAG: tryptophan synthase subunit alpha, partial [Gemmatimonadales bacterium]
TLGAALELVAGVRPSCPVVLFSYLNPVLRYGMEKFLADAADVGIAGVLFTDLPAGGDPEIETMIANSPLDPIRMVAPTTSESRLPVILGGATGFIYLVARLGVTGMSASLDAGLAGSIERVRRHTPLPVAAGFGISTPDQVREAGKLADGVVVGSALVRKVEEDGPDAAIRFLRDLRDALPQAAGAS